MRPVKKYPWGPKDELGHLIGQVSYRQPDPALAGRIMGRLKPIKPSLGKRVVAWLRAPVTFSLSPAFAALVLLMLCLPGGLLVYQWHTNRATTSVALQKNPEVPVIFHFNNASAQSVAVMGSFNHWDPKGYEMRRQPESGKWVIELRLLPGRHDYVFLVNGEKVSPDPDADLIQEDDYGNRNSVLFVKGGHGQQI